jgi:bacterioferritin
MTHKQIDIDEVVKVLNKIMETELAGVVRYTHYALMVYGYSRIFPSFPGCATKRWNH